MKRMILTAVVASLLLVGCGGPKPSDPKSATGKDDPRIQRAGAGGGGASQQQEMIKPPTGKAAE